jgi:16S rRNA (cytosine967-C5)-methyltransferase
LDRLAERGRLVYSTCSLEERENTAVVEEVLRENKGFHLLESRNLLDELKTKGELVWPEVESLTQGSFLRTLPGVHPCDGFFAAVIERD